MCFSNEFDVGFFRMLHRTARKEHQCGECFRKIEAKERYAYASGLCDGSIWDMKICADCEKLRLAIFDKEQEEGCRNWESWCPYGYLQEYLLEIEEEEADQIRARARYLVWPRPKAAA